jgi:hypothetical protein
MFGAREISITEIEKASDHPQKHKDRVFAELADQYRQDLEEWFQDCQAPVLTPGVLAAAVVSS